MEAASNKCCTLRPEGPAAVPFGTDQFKDILNIKIVIRGYMDCAEVVSGIIGSGPFGCFFL